VLKFSKQVNIAVRQLTFLARYSVQTVTKEPAALTSYAGFLSPSERMLDNILNIPGPLPWKLIPIHRALSSLHLVSSYIIIIISGTTQPSK
jgi:hypothetical protein